MSGFSASWLALREEADHSARNQGVANACRAAFARRGTLTIADLGCGTGSNLLAMATLLPEKQHWHLCDYDPALLAAARTALCGWADEAHGDSNGLALRRNDKEISVSFHVLDLTGSLDPIAALKPDLVSATALFDLTSQAWLERFAAFLKAHRLPLMATLTCNGHDDWQPPHALDGAVALAFSAHQQRDKGFGPAAGQRAAGILAGLMRQYGYQCVEGPSPWQLGPSDTGLIVELAQGTAGAAVETGLVTPADAEEWREARKSAIACTIGHDDLFAQLV